MTSITSSQAGPIGIFDSGFGGLTILSEIKKAMPQYDYIYLGDNARAPYGPRSNELIYRFTLQAVRWLFDAGCHLVIIACNTASAKALRKIQINDLPSIDSNKRVLGVIRPTSETIVDITQTKHIAILATEATIRSGSYKRELEKFDQDIIITTEACPMWVPLVENQEYNKDGADYFIKQHLDKVFSHDNKIDTIILGCTHFPLLIEKIRKYTPHHINIISQGEYIAKSLRDYLDRHQSMDERCIKNGKTTFYTTESAKVFEKTASFFLNKKIKAEKIELRE